MSEINNNSRRIATSATGFSILTFDASEPPPIDIGNMIGPSSIVVEDSAVDDYAGYAVALSENTQIWFPLDVPGAAGVVENADNWGLGPLGVFAEEFWKRGFTGKGCTIGIADSGLDPTAPTFEPLIKEGRLLSFAAFDAKGIKQIQRDATGAQLPDKDAIPSSAHWHGTFCAAVIAGSNDGFQRGVAPGANLCVSRVLQQGNVGTVASIGAGLYWLGEQKIDFASLSLGWPGLHEEWADPIRALVDKGVVVVAAVGNEFGVAGVEPTRSPANYPIVAKDGGGKLISVGAFAPDSSVADFSGGGVVDWHSVVVKKPDGGTAPSIFASNPTFVLPHLVGPGVDIIEPVNPNTYLSESGSSMATPHVVGLMALVLSVLRSRSANATPLEAAELVLKCLKPLAEGVAAFSDTSREGGGKIDKNHLFNLLFL